MFINLIRASLAWMSLSRKYNHLGSLSFINSQQSLLHFITALYSILASPLLHFGGALVSYSKATPKWCKVSSGGIISHYFPSFLLISPHPLICERGGSCAILMTMNSCLRYVNQWTISLKYSWSQLNLFNFWTALEQCKGLASNNVSWIEHSGLSAPASVFF